MSPSSAKPTIYLVDDNPNVCDALTFLFKSVHDINVITYHDPLLFLNDFSTDWCGCLIIDLMMPSMSGIQLISALNQRHCHMRILVISGHATHQLAEQALRAGAYAFIPKPFKLPVLLDHVKTILQQANALNRSS
jgi:FixJ family two-component response regulator